MDVNPDKISVLYSGVNLDLYKPCKNLEKIKKVRDKYSIPDKYYLYLGTLEPRKNIERLIMGYGILKSKKEKKIPKLVIAGKKGWMYEDIFKLVKEKDSNELRLSSVSKGETPICYVTYNQTGYTTHCLDYKNYKDWEKNRNPIRYESNLNKNYDSKNMMHCTRLIHMGLELAKGEGFNIERTWDREFLLNIRNHKIEYDELIDYIEQKHQEFNEAIKTSQIKEKIDVDFVNNLLIEIRKEQLKKILLLL